MRSQSHGHGSTARRWPLRVRHVIAVALAACFAGVATMLFAHVTGLTAAEIDVDFEGVKPLIIEFPRDGAAPTSVASGAARNGDSEPAPVDSNAQPGRIVQPSQPLIPGTRRGVVLEWPARSTDDSNTNKPATVRISDTPETTDPNQAAPSDADPQASSSSDPVADSSNQTQQSPANITVTVPHQSVTARQSVVLEWPRRRLTASTSNTTTGHDHSKQEETARSVMAEALALAAAGETDAAIKLAQLADSFGVEWNNDEQSPEQLLTTLSPPTAPATKPEQPDSNSNESTFRAIGTWEPFRSQSVSPASATTAATDPTEPRRLPGLEDLNVVPAAPVLPATVPEVADDGGFRNNNAIIPFVSTPASREPATSVTQESIYPQPAPAPWAQVEASSSETQGDTLSESDGAVADASRVETPRQQVEHPLATDIKHVTRHNIDTAESLRPRTETRTSLITLDGAATNVLMTLICVFAVLFFGSLLLLLAIMSLARRVIANTGLTLKVELVNGPVAVATPATVSIGPAAATVHAPVTETEVATTPTTERETTPVEDAFGGSTDSPGPGVSSPQVGLTTPTAEEAAPIPDTSDSLKAEATATEELAKTVEDSQPVSLPIADSTRPVDSGISLEEPVRQPMTAPEPVADTELQSVDTQPHAEQDNAPADVSAQPEPEAEFTTPTLETELSPGTSPTANVEKTTAENTTVEKSDVIPFDTDQFKAAQPDDATPATDPPPFLKHFIASNADLRSTIADRQKRAG